MKNLQKAILETWLPTKWSRLTAGATISLIISSIGLPEFLRSVHIEISDCTALLIRIGMPLLVLLLGSLAVLAIVVQYAKTLKTQKTPSTPIPPPIAKPAQLPKEQIHILNVLSKQELLTFQIAQRVNMEDKEDIVKYHLQELAKGNFVREINLPGIGPPGQSSWFATDKGKKYLIENKLIS